MEPQKPPPTDQELEIMRLKKEQDAIEDLADEKRALEEKRKQKRATFAASPWSSAMKTPATEDGESDNWVEAEEAKLKAKQERAAKKKQDALVRFRARPERRSCSSVFL